MRVKLDRTVCDGFGVCARRAPEYFSLDDWGYASLIGNGSVPDQDRDAVMRALMDCPVHAIVELSEDNAAPAPPPPSAADFAITPELKTDDNEAEWGFTR
ncbi:MAG: ferredoxin [Mycobacteriaceae bacterium]|nr:ferredoxin [Mycobacteriaceae bacterium]MBV9640948.1 ferredoxin [Mycobacteriaceae bacterium]